jgi:hypothetical protein
VTDSAAAEQGAVDVTARRALMGAGVVGAALAVAVSRPAAAQPTPISDADRALAEFAIEFELAVRDLYQVVIDGGAKESAWDLLRLQHASYAERIAGVTGMSASGRNESVYEANVDAFAGDRPANAAYDLENIAVATHANLLVSAVDNGIADALAAIASMESRHAAYLAERSGRGGNLDALFVNTAEPITPEAGS